MSNKEFDSSFLKVDGRTDVGCKRAVNEDYFGRESTPNGLAVVVCDGMGGYVGGEIASKTAVGAILQHLKEHLYNEPQEAIFNAIIEANRAVLKKVQLHPGLMGMGCTCVLLLVDRKGIVYAGHVGDSRIYLIRDGLATHLTKDQSYVQTLVDDGVISPLEAEHHPRNNEITNAIGMDKMTPPVIREKPVRPLAGDCFLLCSDGLNKVVPESDIVNIVSERSYDVSTKVGLLIDTAKRNGGPDNITVQLVEFSASPDEVRLMKEKRSIVRYAFLSLSVIAFVLLLFFCVSIWKKNETVQSEPQADPEPETNIPQKTESQSDQPINKDLLSSQSAEHSPIGQNDRNNVTSDENDKSNDKVSVDKIPGSEVDGNTETFGTQANSVDNMNENASTNNASEEVKEVRKFKKSDIELHIDKPKRGYKYTADCCERLKDQPYLDSQVEIKEDKKGGLIIRKKNTSQDINWTGYKIIIDKYCKGDNSPQQSYKIIVIEFD